MHSGSGRARFRSSLAFGVEVVGPERYSQDMPTEGLEVRLRQGREHVDVGRFTKDLESIAASLREIDRAAVQDQKRISWVVERLSTVGDWLTVKLVVRPDQRLVRPVSSIAVPVDALVSGVQSLNNESLIPQFYSAGPSSGSSMSASLGEG